MNQSISKVVIVGGGSAGWLTAGLLAAELSGDKENSVQITLIESPDVQTIGVGEGTWPTMRDSLKKIGIGERDFLRRCSASFKQGTQFLGWTNGNKNDRYYHPFSAPIGYGEMNLVPYWQQQRDKVSFANAIGIQGFLCDRDLAPKQASTPDYAFVANYGYHLDAGKFAEVLQEHCTERLGVRHLRDHVTRINGGLDTDIRSVSTQSNDEVEGDLFIDCTGLKSLLLGEHYGVPFINRNSHLFNDSALAVQVPYASASSPIASQTNSTAQRAGWIWDIGLQNRRGVGYTYSSGHINEAHAIEALRSYVSRTSPGVEFSFEPRKIRFNSGHRDYFWHRNCVAVGMSAGFLEPLEASALVMIELAGQTIAEQFPRNRELMDIVAGRYNKLFSYRWDRIIDFLKLHYVLSQRNDSDFWRDNRSQESIPDSLAENLALWAYRVPWHQDFAYQDEIFSSASYQYVLYGMGFTSKSRRTDRFRSGTQAAKQFFRKNHEQGKRIIGQLPSNRELLSEIMGNA